jgi:uncharacterized membrane protein YgcG
MKKIYKKINYVFLAMGIFFVGILINVIAGKSGRNQSSIENAFADTPPVFTPEQIATWISVGGDSGGGGPGDFGGDSTGGSGSSGGGPS